MAIKNASDLLVYKTVVATAQITRVLFEASPTSGTLGNLKIKDTTNASGAVADVTTGNMSANSALQAATVCKAGLETKGYTVGTPVAVGSSYYIDCTNGAVGNVATISIEGGTATLDESKVSIIVTTSGLAAGQEPIAYSTSASVSFNMDLRDTTTKDSGGYQNNLGGLKSFELSTDALFDLTADLDFQEFFNDLKNRTLVTVRFAERTSGRYYQGAAFVTSLSMDAGVEENTTYSVTFTGTGTATTSTY